MRFIPEKTVDLCVLRDPHSKAHEIIPEGLRVEAGGVQHLPRQRGDLSVADVVLKKQTDLLSAEIFPDPPQIRQTPQSDVVRRFYDIVQVGEPEIHIEFRNRENHRVAAVLEHLQEIGTRVLLVIHAVIANGGMLDCHILLLLPLTAKPHSGSSRRWQTNHPNHIRYAAGMRFP